MKVLVVGNCQARPLSLLLDLMVPDATVLEPVVVQLVRPRDEAPVLSRMAEADVILAQLVGPAYRAECVRTNVLKDRFGDRVHSWVNLYWRGQNPELVYKRELSSPLLPLGDYHIEAVYEGWSQGADAARVAARLADRDWNAERYGNVGQASLHELAERERLADAQITDVIASAGSSRRLFFTMNHPTLELLSLYAVRLLRAIGVTPACQPPPGAMPEPLNPVVPPPNPASGLPQPEIRTYRALEPANPGGTRLKAVYLSETGLVERFYRAYDSLEPA